MPKENIERAIEKGKGIGAEQLNRSCMKGTVRTVLHLLIEAATDNRQRTVSVIKNLLERKGERLQVPELFHIFLNAAEFLRSQRRLPYHLIHYLRLALDSGAMTLSKLMICLRCIRISPGTSRSQTNLRKKGIAVDNTEIIMKPKTSISFDTQK